MIPEFSYFDELPNILALPNILGLDQVPFGAEYLPSGKQTANSELLNKSHQSAFINASGPTHIKPSKKTPQVLKPHERPL